MTHNVFVFFSNALKHMAQKKISLGIGFGKVLNEDIRERNGAAKETPSLTE
jgi:hypothetical protein